MRAVGSHSSQGSAIFTLANIDPQTEAERYWAHVVALYFNSALVAWVLFRLYEYYYLHRAALRCYVTPANRTALFTSVPVGLSDESIRDHLDNLFPEQVLQVRRVEEQHRLGDLLHQRKKLREERERVFEDGPLRMRETTRALACNPLCLSRPKVDALSFLNRSIRHLNLDIAWERQLGVRTPTPIVYVTFRSNRTAVIAATCHAHADPARWQSRPAPVPPLVLC